MRTEFLCISVLRVASGPRVMLASSKNALNPPVVYSTDRSKAVVLVLFLLFVFFSICVVMLALWSPFSTAAHFAFCLSRCVVMLAFCHLQLLPILLSDFLFVIKSGIGTQGEVG